jgi:hypothetical protein
MRKFAITFMVLALVSFGIFMPQGSAAACSGSNCFGHDPATTTNGAGVYCASSAFTYTVTGSFQGSGTNGTVLVELRYSDPTIGTNPNVGCQANWSRATVKGTNSSTRQLAAKAFQTLSPSFRSTKYIQGSPLLAYNAYTYSFMIDGSVTVTAVGAISGTLCTSDYGDPDTTCKTYYNPNIRYSG